MQELFPPEAPAVQSRVQLIQGDCLDVMPTIEAGSVQMCFADLPYGVTRHAYDTKVALNKFWLAVNNCVASRCLYIFTATQPFTTDLINSNRSLFRYDIIWSKTRPGGFLNANRMPLRAHEHVLIFYEKKGTYNPQFTEASKPSNRQSRSRSDVSASRSNSYGKHLNNSQRQTCLRYPVSVKTTDNVNNNGILHPAQKPVTLLEWLIKTYTNEGDTILDPCAGSGTTAIAAMRTGRHAICIEKDETYFKVMQKRVADEQVRLGLTHQRPLSNSAGLARGKYDDLMA